MCGEGEGSADALGGGGLVSPGPRGGRDAGARGRRLAMLSLHSRGREYGLGEDVTALPWWHEKGQGYVCSHSPFHGRAQLWVLSEGDASSMGTIPNPQHLSGHVAVKPLHLLHIGCSY